MVGAQLLHLGSVDVRFTFSTGWWESRTFGAAGVRAVDAHFLCAKCCLTTVTGTANPHTDWLCHSVELLKVGWGFPCIWVEIQAVLGEECAGLRMIRSGEFGHNHWCWLTGFLGWCTSSGLDWGWCRRTVPGSVYLNEDRRMEHDVRF